MGQIMYLKPLKMPHPRVLVVGGDAALRRQMLGAFADKEFSARGAADGRVARQRLDTGGCDLLIVCAELAKTEVLALRAAIRRRGLSLPVIVLAERAGWNGMNFFDLANLLGATVVLQRPISGEILRRVARETLEPRLSQQTPWFTVEYDGLGDGARA